MNPIKSHVSLADVAKLAGCTAASVSLVLNDSPLPSARMRERVRQAAARLGYVPNRMAQRLKRGRTFTLGVVMPYCADSYVSTLLDLLSVEAAEFGFQLEIHFHRWSVEAEDRALKTLGEARVEGIFLSGSRENYEDVPTLQSLRNQRIPIVGIMRQPVPSFASTLVVDRFGGARDLGSHLAQLGHRHIDYLEPTGTREWAEATPKPIQTLLRGLRQGTLAHCNNPRIEFFKTKPEYLLSRRDIEQHGFSAASMDSLTDRFLKNYLESQSPATAIVTFHLVLAWKLLAALSEKNLRCPQDVSVACINEEGGGALGAVPLTASEYSMNTMAKKGIAAMLAAIEGRKVARTITIPTQFIQRASSGPL